MNENRRLLYLIPLVGILAIPQILFFWLAPKVDCYFAVYIFGTLLTMIHAALSFYMLNTYGVRRAAATVTVGAVIATALLIVGAILLGGAATVRTACFSLAVVTVIYVICEVLLMLTVMKEPAPERANPSGHPAAREPQRVCAPNADSDLNYRQRMALQHEALYRPQNPAPARPARQTPAPPPLP